MRLGLHKISRVTPSINLSLISGKGDNAQTEIVSLTASILHIYCKPQQSSVLFQLENANFGPKTEEIRLRVAMDRCLVFP